MGYLLNYQDSPVRHPRQQGGGILASLTARATLALTWSRAALLCIPLQNGSSAAGWKTWRMAMPGPIILQLWRRVLELSSEAYYSYYRFSGWTTNNAISFIKNGYQTPFWPSRPRLPHSAAAILGINHVVFMVQEN